jgi:hypothetical protein
MNLFIAKEQLFSLCKNKQVLRNIEIDNKNLLNTKQSRKDIKPLIDWNQDSLSDI